VLEAVQAPSSTEADKGHARKRTGAVAWAAGLRPSEEHEQLAEVLVRGLARTTDEAQAGTLVWGLAGLKGLQTDARLRVAQSLIGLLPGQTSPAIAQQYVRAVDQLAAGSQDRSGFLRLVQEAAAAQGHDRRTLAHLQWLEARLRR
jgi:hypothetical protein